MMMMMMIQVTNIIFSYHYLTFIIFNYSILDLDANIEAELGDDGDNFSINIENYQLDDSDSCSELVMTHSKTKQA